MRLGVKRLLISVVDKNRQVGHPIYVEKSVLKQAWEMFIYPLLALVLGIIIGVIFE